jgi:hypothetical protein
MLKKNALRAVVQSLMEKGFYGPQITKKGLKKAKFVQNV